MSSPNHDNSALDHPRGAERGFMPLWHRSTDTRLESGAECRLIGAPQPNWSALGRHYGREFLGIRAPTRPDRPTQPDRPARPDRPTQPDRPHPRASPHGVIAPHSAVAIRPAGGCGPHSCPNPHSPPAGRRVSGYDPPHGGRRPRLTHLERARSPASPHLGRARRPRLTPPRTRSGTSSGARTPRNPAGARDTSACRGAGD